MSLKINSKYQILLPLFIVVFTSCKYVSYSEFKNDAVIGIVDSVDNTVNAFNPSTDCIWVKGKKYDLFLNYYYDFSHYVQKGDSVYNKAGHWDVFVYRKKDGKYIEKYFRGAPDEIVEDNFLDSLLNSKIIFIIVILLAIALSIRKIKLNERGVIFRLERFFKIVEPGVIFVIPFVDKMIKVNLNDRLPGWYDLKEDELNEKVKEIVITDK